MATEFKDFFDALSAIQYTSFILSEMMCDTEPTSGRKSIVFRVSFDNLSVAQKQKVFEVFCDDDDVELIICSKDNFVTVKLCVLGEDKELKLSLKDLKSFYYVL